MLLDLLGSRLTNQAAVVAAHISNDCLVKPVATHTDRLGVHNTVQGDQGNLGGTATDIHYHRATRLFYRQACTNRCGHWLFNQIHFTRTCSKSRLANGPAFNLGRLARHTDQHPRARLNEAVFMHFINEILQHFFANTEVGNDAVFHRTNGLNVAGRTPQHAFGVSSDRNHTFLVAFGTNCYHRRLVQHNTLVAHTNQGIGRPEVNGQVAGKNATNFLEHE